MRKTALILILILALLATVAGCTRSSEGFKVASRSGKGYFKYTEPLPDVRLATESGDATEEKLINDRVILEKLAALIDGRVMHKQMYNCSPYYNIRIEGYLFGIHTHCITVFSIGKDEKASLDLIGISDCTDAEIAELFAIIKATD